MGWFLVSTYTRERKRADAMFVSRGGAVFQFILVHPENGAPADQAVKKPFQNLVGQAF